MDTRVITAIENIDPICNFVEYDGMRIFKVYMPDGSYLKNMVCFPCLGDSMAVRRTFGPELPMGLHVKDGLAVFGIEIPTYSGAETQQKVISTFVDQVRVAVQSMKAALAAGD
jgi:hypothetical protein